MTERLESERAELVALADRIETHINYGTSLIIHLSDQKALLTALRRSSQSTSDAGGGVRELTEQEHLAVQQALIDSGDTVEALSKPAPVAANASAEARLREALEKIAADHDCGCKPCTGQCRSEESLRIIVDEMRDIASEALSPDPHASDCDKQGETTTWDMEPNGWVTIRPSDRTADVTEFTIRAALDQAIASLDEIAASHIPDCPAHYAGDELAWAQRHVGYLRGKAKIARDGIEDAISDAFRVGRR